MAPEWSWIRFFANRHCGGDSAAEVDPPIYLHFRFRQMTGRIADSATRTARSALAAGVRWKGWDFHFTHLAGLRGIRLNRNFRFGPLACTSCASPALDSANLPPEQAPAK